jgi:acetyl esterase/lipase
LPSQSTARLQTVVTDASLSRAAVWMSALLIPLLALTGCATISSGVSAWRDVPYVANGHPRQQLDLYLPRSGEAAPLIITIHGGGWLGGDKAEMPFMPFLAEGYAVASINYRLSQHAVFPAQIEDCKAAVRWLRRNSAQFNIDPDRIGVWGPSAGGHLAALLGTAGETRIFDVGENLDVSSAVQAVQRANPITYITPQAPPFLIAHGDADPLAPHHQSELLEAALKSAGVPVKLHTVKRGGHGFRDARADELRRRFFAEHLE